MKYCSAAHCNSTNIKGPTRKESTFLYKFPNKVTQSSRWLRWKAFISNQRKDFQPTNTSYICSRHFSEADFENIGEYDFKVETLKLDPG